jgi:signal transduction histidine kinase
MLKELPIGYSTIVISTMELNLLIDHTSGLKLLTDDLNLIQLSSGKSVDSDRYDTICDVNSANRTALDILNDLLSFEKLESGILEVHKHEVSVLPFISECVEMFSSQVRDSGVNVMIKSECTVDNNDPTDDKNLNLRSTLPLTEGDTVFMDKFKMDQVLRNLVSNALKFTPRGGTITINATFVPKVDKIENGPTEPKKWVNFYSLWFYLLSFTHSLTSRIHVSDISHDLEAGTYRHSGTNRDAKTYRAPLKQSKGNQNKIITNSDQPTNNDTDVDNKNGTTFGKLVITVTDTGVGLSEINQKRLFKEVVQFNPELLQAGGGSGLGLWITNNIG